MMSLNKVAQVQLCFISEITPVLFREDVATLDFLELELLTMGECHYAIQSVM